MTIPTPTDLRGPARPATGTRALPAGARRRTSTLDVARPEGADGVRTVHGTAADADGDGVGRASTLDAVVAFDGTLESLAVDGSQLVELDGTTVGPGFRSKAAEVFADERRAGTPSWALLDDLPAISLVSGYARLAAGYEPPWVREGRAPKADICSGWRADGTLVQLSLRRGRQVFTPGPEAPPLADAPRGPAPSVVRRHRRLDVTPGDVVSVDAMFRDTYSDPRAIETVIHEYALTATVDPASQTVLDITAEPRVLPYLECPAAAASASRIVGKQLRHLRDEVRAELVGTSTCTHLNDMLRSLDDVAALVGEW